MTKRFAAAVLWFLATWLGYGLLAYAFGLPDSIGAALGMVVAAGVWIDPAQRLWPHAER